MKVRLIRKIFTLDELDEIEDYSYNHAYTKIGEDRYEVLYFVAESREEFQRAIGLKSQKETP